MNVLHKRGARAALALLLTLLLCVAMNFAAFFIDTQTMRENAAQGVAVLGQEGGTPQLIGGFKSAQLDNFTSVLIIKTAAYTGPEPLVQKAFGGIRTDLPAAEGQDEWSAFCTYADGGASPVGGLSYSRYWHGYTFALRLLLCAFNLSNLQMLLLFASLFLAFAVLALCAKRAPAALPGLAAAWFLLMPLACGVCLQYVPATLLALAACLLVLLADERIAHAVGMPAFFALTGMLTNYFDLLTFPLITLGFPLALLLALRLRRGDSLPALMGTLIGCGVAWALGYAGMWAFKWLLVAAVYGPDRLAGIFTQAALRVSSSSNGEAFSRLGALQKNLDVLFAKSAYLLLLLFAAAASCAVSLVRALRIRRAGGRVRLNGRVLPLALLALVPFAWYIAMANHSFDHAFFTYRNLTAAVLAMLTALGCLTREAAEIKD